MPSPLGHVIGGVAAGFLVAGVPGVMTRGGRASSANQARWREAIYFAALAALPDVDLLVGAHSGPTHSLGAAVIVGVLAGFVISRGHGSLGRLGTLTAMIASASAYGSHVLLDWLSRDTTAPIGVMALWPWSRMHYESDLHLFMAISRRYYQGWTFVRQNGLAVMRELAILIPILLLVAVLRPRHPRRD